MKIYGGIEAGGTKIICCIGNDKGEILDSCRVDTETPAITMPKIINFFKKQSELASIGIGAFGPVDLNLESNTYGYITHTPKTKWKMYNFLGEMRKHFDIPMGFDTDVNVAALGEYTWGAAKDLSDFLYITVGTGVGVGHIVNHQFAHGLIHPEMGHIIVNKSVDDLDSFNGICPYHSNCLEGMAAGPAINARWEVDHCSVLPTEHLAWEIEADYLAQALRNYILICSPKKIIIGGGVMNQKQLFPLIRNKVQTLLNGYVHHPYILDNINNYIVPPGLGGEAGMKGAIALAIQTA
jgi:fructokinase